MDDVMVQWVTQVEQWVLVVGVTTGTQSCTVVHTGDVSEFKEDTGMVEEEGVDMEIRGVSAVMKKK